MKKVILLLIVLLLLIATSCSNSISQKNIKQGSSGDAIFIGITKNGIMADASEVVINNFHPGAKAEVVYRIHNGTTAPIVPEIYFVDYADITDYSQANGAIKAPVEVSKWLKIPKIDEIVAGEIKDITVVIEMPKDAKDIPDKIGFQVQTAGNNGGIVQTAVGTWWIINMR